MLSHNSFIFTGLFCRNTVCFLSTETASFSSAISRKAWVFGTFTWIPDWMTGAVTIKMMSRTRTMSMNGIMLISASVVWVLPSRVVRSEEHTSELQSQSNLVCRLLLEKKKNNDYFISVLDHLQLDLSH